MILVYGGKRDMGKNKRYETMTTEESIDSEQEFYRDEEKEKSRAEVETKKSENKTGIVDNSIVVKVRRFPDLRSEIVGILPKGSNVVIHKKLTNLNNDFYQISTSSIKRGFILSSFIKED